VRGIAAGILLLFAVIWFIASGAALALLALPRENKREREE
jgi:hypothetical protein